MHKWVRCECQFLKSVSVRHGTLFCWCCFWVKTKVVHCLRTPTLHGKYRFGNGEFEDSSSPPQTKFNTQLWIKAQDYFLDCSFFVGVPMFHLTTIRGSWTCRVATKILFTPLYHLSLSCQTMCQALHRSLLSLNARLGQPSQRRRAHRLYHQSRWADHSEYIESVKSVVCCGSNFQLVGTEIALSRLWLMRMVYLCIYFIDNQL